MIDGICGLGVACITVFNLASAAFCLVKVESDRRKEDDQERRIGKALKKNKALKAELEAKEKELWKARSEAKTARHLAAIEYEAEISRLRDELAESKRKCDNFEVMLEQKWKEAKE